jgi:hypothetical protein
MRVACDGHSRTHAGGGERREAADSHGRRLALMAKLLIRWWSCRACHGGLTGSRASGYAADMRRPRAVALAAEPQLAKGAPNESGAADGEEYHVGSGTPNSFIQAGVADSFTLT